MPRHFTARFDEYRRSDALAPLLLCGDAREVLFDLPAESVDFCMTSPPYWGHRSYDGGGIGQEATYEAYIGSLAEIFREVQRVLKPAGSFWLNIGDTYENKQLLGIPWRVAIHLTDKQGWILRNSVIWNKVKGGPDNSTDKLRNIHENVFHFVKNARSYYYDADSIRSKPREARVVNGVVISATGVSGVRYRRQLELSTSLSKEEKSAAYLALDGALADVQAGTISDFRMIIRGQQRTTHSDSELVSGRARELKDKGFYFLRYHPNGAKPPDVWEIIPEDTQGREVHFAPYPEDLCRLPLLATCPPAGIALDPFCGTGTTNLVAFMSGRKSVGIDIAAEYIELAVKRCQRLL